MAVKETPERKYLILDFSVTPISSSICEIDKNDFSFQNENKCVLLLLINID